MIRSLQDLIVHHNRATGSLTKDISSKGLSLKKGDVVSGKVLDYNRSGQAKLLVQGKQLTAQTSVQLTKGQLAQFRVEQTQPNYIFKVFTGAGMQNNALQWMGSAMQASPFQIFQNLFQMIEKNADNSNQKNLMQLVHLLSQMAIKPGDTITPYYLMAFMQRSGLLWENKLKQWFTGQKDINHDRLKKLLQQDFKGLALQAHQNIPDEALEVKVGLEQLIHQIEQWQLLNHKALSENGKLYFMLPLLFGNNFQTGELLIDVSDSKKGQKDPSESMLKASLLLKMSQIGPVKVEAVLFKRQLRIDYWMSNEESINLFKQNELFISKSLGIHGIHIQMIAYHLTDEKQFDEISLIQDIVKSNQHLNTFA
ncbi:hypothetical protein MHK_006326 [Candidatus Magnetomorum sp. HK-1]|nr:hypothetical protein MHK_006326 [Candidatus Magnetomorum sp. HK-1]